MREKPKRKNEDKSHPEGCACMRCFRQKCVDSFRYLYAMIDKHIKSLQYLNIENKQRKLEIEELRKELDALKKEKTQMKKDITKLKKETCKCQQKSK